RWRRPRRPDARGRPARRARAERGADAGRPRSGAGGRRVPAAGVRARRAGATRGQRRLPAVRAAALAGPRLFRLVRLVGHVRIDLVGLLLELLGRSALTLGAFGLLFGL